MKRFVYGLTIFLSLAVAGALMTGCGGGNRDAGKVLAVEEVDPGDSAGGSGSGSGTDTGDSTTTDGSTDNTYHPIFSKALGVPISNQSGIIDPDPTGYTANTDYDGDGIPNDHEKVSNPYVADYPRIVTRIATPITMEIRINESSVTENHTETVEDTGVKNTIGNSMEDKHYTSMNRKTTPYVTKESQSTSDANSESYGYEKTKSRSGGVDVSFPKGGGIGGESSSSSSTSENWAFSEEHAQSTMSEKTVFDDVDYTDNLDRNGVEFTNDTVQTMSQNFRKSEVLKTTQEIPANAGFVRASLFLKNMTVNIPVRISNVVCTLSFRTPAGEFLPVKTFKLRNEDYSEFSQDVYGDEELGPYTLEITNLNTHEIKKALANGYVPQINVVSYDMKRVNDSNYNPGVDNLKIVEETAKGRTSLLKFVGKNMREIYRVAAFDVNAQGDISPGISLKKAIFNVLRSRTGSGEKWETDNNGRGLTVPDEGLRWKTGSAEHLFQDEIAGNKWEMFETYIKKYTDKDGDEHRIETIKRIGNLQKYNPFNPVDNPSYDVNEALSKAEIYKMKYFIILHNGRYFKGDINDPIWVGERYEIIFYEVEDFNNHFENYYYTPIQSASSFILDTRWNRLNQDDAFKRATYLGQVVQGDVLHLEVDLINSRSLFNNTTTLVSGGTPEVDSVDSTQYNWHDDIFNYTFNPENPPSNCIPGQFVHTYSGSTVSVIVDIDASECAEFYEISYFTPGNEVQTKGKVVVTADELEDNYGRVVISKHNIRNQDPANWPLNYSTFGENQQLMVNVTAFSTVYGVERVPHQSDNNNRNSMVVTALNSSGDNPDNGYTYSAVGLTNSINLNIEESDNAEYYKVLLEGPLNYSADNTLREYVGFSGFNKINVNNPGSNVIDPGVYRIRVIAANRYSDHMSTDPATLESETGMSYIIVDYDPYREQKVHSPFEVTRLQGMDTIDLEVNFNDGSGWYRLHLTNMDTASQYIDCRYTSYIEYDKQKVHIFFRIPDGVYGQSNQTVPEAYNVFTGGREVADVYLRTVADNKYRDTFWLKRDAGSDNYIQTSNSVSDFVSYWINNAYSDASYIDDIVSNTLVPDFTFSAGTTKGDFYFSPSEHRIMEVKALLTDSLGVADTNRIDKPLFSAAPGNKSISLSGIGSDYAESYIYYWRPIDGLTSDELSNLTGDMNLFSWETSGQVAATDVVDGSDTIDNLMPNRNYAVAVKAVNEFGRVSEPAFLLDGVSLKPVMPYSNDQPSPVENFTINLGSDGKSIIAGNIHSPGEYRYQVSWSSEGGDSGSSGILESFEPFSHPIENLNYWDRYTVSVWAITGSGVTGPSTELMIDTAEQEDIGSISYEWSDYSWYRDGVTNHIEGTLAIVISDLNLPNTTSNVAITWELYDGNRPTGFSGAQNLASFTDPERIFIFKNYNFRNCYNHQTYSGLSIPVIHFNMTLTNSFGETKSYVLIKLVKNWYDQSDWTWVQKSGL